MVHVLPIYMVRGLQKADRNHAINWVVKIQSPFYQGIESASSPGLYSLDVQYFRRTVFPRELSPGGTVFPKGIRSAGPKIGPDRIPFMTPALRLTLSYYLHII